MLLLMHGLQIRAISVANPRHLLLFLLYQDKKYNIRKPLHKHGLQIRAICFCFFSIKTKKFNKRKSLHKHGLQIRAICVILTERCFLRQHDNVSQQPQVQLPQSYNISPKFQNTPHPKSPVICIN
jgi:hypothetical protein